MKRERFTDEQIVHAIKQVEPGVCAVGADAESKGSRESDHMSEKDFSRLSRPIHPMPGFVADALETSGLLAAYLDRPSKR